MKILVCWSARQEVVNLEADFTFAHLLKTSSRALGVEEKTLQALKCSVVELGRDVHVLEEPSPVAKLSEVGIVARSTVFFYNLRSLEERALRDPKRKDPEKKTTDKGDSKGVGWFAGMTAENVLEAIKIKFSAWVTAAKSRDLRLAWQFLDTFADSVVRLPAFETLDKPLLAAIVRRSTLNVREALLFSRVVAWGTPSFSSIFARSFSISFKYQNQIRQKATSKQ